MANNQEDSTLSIPFDTSLNMLPYLLFMRKARKSRNSMVFATALVILLYYIVPSLAAMILLPETFTSSPSLQIPYFKDWNVMFMCVITFPGIFYLLMTEKKMLSDSVNEVLDHETLKLNNKDELFRKWKKRYAIINVLGQVIGAIVGALVSYGNYSVASSKGFYGWQVSNGTLNIPGYIFIFVQMPIFFFLVITYLVRTLAHIAFFYDMASMATFNLSPVDPDNAGGLRPLGRIGLRNQYVLAMGGLNIGLFLIVMQKLNRIPMLDYLFIAAVMFYVVAGPIGFLGPLLPFRSRMLEAKRQYLGTISNKIKKEFDAIIHGLSEQGYSEVKHKEMQRYEHLQSIARGIPVWPFDSRTLRKFLGAYIIPFGAFVLGPFVNEIMKVLASYIGK